MEAWDGISILSELWPRLVAVVLVSALFVAPHPTGAFLTNAINAYAHKLSSRVVHDLAPALKRLEKHHSAGLGHIATRRNEHS
jgi:hypothetical protein